MEKMDFTSVQHGILNYMWKNVKSSRNELSLHLKVNPSTISRNLSPLTKYGIVKAAGESPASSKGGRKTRILSFNEEWKKILGVSIEQGEITIALTTLRGRILKKEYSTMNVNEKNIVEIVKNIHSRYNSSDILGVSVAVPGIVSTKEGIIVFSSALNIKEMPLAKIMEDEFMVKALVMNNANAAAASHFMESNDLIYFIFSIPYFLEKPVGIGAGIMINGEIHEGFNSRAGEFWKSFSLTDEKGLTVNDLKSEKVLKKLRLRDFVNYFSNFLEVALNTVDPEVYIVGGDVTMLPAWVSEELIKSVDDKMPIQFANNKMNGVVDKNGTFSIAKGAALGFSTKIMKDFNFARQIFDTVEME